ncbi:hypothetical protein PF005_g27772 [Phytophthora fragariae]|uniref:Uncharacterized protein n=1 Tax=Phytophthora fragariae TaxID=53985 RepID=A0A6A4BPK9_9STRA|nr:hypothetical protein PF003_g16661 [Phytophthora fragariae]KAE8935913.1 hypothetical protein PF009_g14155 [Phytophthora fragariae]KAE9101531.1 hypothetical protein PF007_g15110 [Phytophthora fragariae]KAE9119673.1 hypothetical protein PF006_g18311 [Phytophthora fragariae]KAE9169911.1 hypothetical protein PF005_g27772 [Phytophthora fragariae]
MTPRLALNTLAFLGPNHGAELKEFWFVRLVQVDDDSASVRAVGPDSDDDSQEVVVPVSFDVTGVTSTIDKRKRNTLTATDAWRLCCCLCKMPCLIGPL